MPSCESRDPIERARHNGSFRVAPGELTAEVLELAWSGYFGEQQGTPGGCGAAGLAATPFQPNATLAR
jgi:hypothetical protein